jgi:hypothetical protein
MEIYPILDKNAINNAVERAMKKLPEREYK